MKRISTFKVYCLKNGKIAIPVEKLVNGIYKCIVYKNYGTFVAQPVVKRQIRKLKKNELYKLSRLVALTISEAKLPSSPVRAFQYK